MSYSKSKGFTLLEVIVTIALVVMISTLVYSSFAALNDRQILDKEVARVKSYIQKARMDSLNAKNGDSHGIVFASSSITVVEIATTTMNVFTLNNRVNLVSSTLGTSTVIFSRISGLPSATGTLTYTYTAGGKVVGTSTIIINGVGIVQ